MGKGGEGNGEQEVGIERLMAGKGVVTERRDGFSVGRADSRLYRSEQGE